MTPVDFDFIKNPTCSFNELLAFHQHFVDIYPQNPPDFNRLRKKFRELLHIAADDVRVNPEYCILVEEGTGDLPLVSVFKKIYRYELSDFTADSIVHFKIYAVDSITMKYAGKSKKELQEYILTLLLFYMVYPIRCKRISHEKKSPLPDTAD